MNKRAIGSAAEDIVKNYLEQNGYTIVERNVHLSILGELDFVARDEIGEIVFVEVRSISQNYIAPEQILPHKKLRMLKRSARIWLASYGLNEFKTDWRIDLAVVDYRRPHTNYRIVYFQRII